MPAPNDLFCVIAAASPQIVQCKLARYYPAASSVEAATSQSRLPVVGKRGGQRVRTRQRQRNKIESEVQFDSVVRNSYRKECLVLKYVDSFSLKNG
jgi:hypothetical protein